MATFEGLRTSLRRNVMCDRLPFLKYDLYGRAQIMQIMRTATHGHKTVRRKLAAVGSRIRRRHIVCPSVQRS
jgi:hypothetical protein